MYRTEPLFPYADRMYAIMPPGLPDRFYPEEKDRVHVEKDYVICFDKGVSDDIKQRLIKDYDKNYKKEKESGVFR
ncbi:MAG: hypothetical protein HDT47_01155 [Ruminococcaceae bacterium]|nr:hypothetical protein [Oscillospiraceae bacterium]